MRTLRTLYLHSLYNGIMNDHSIQLYTMGWRDVASRIRKMYKHIPATDQEFQEELIINALSCTSGAMREQIEVFAKGPCEIEI